MIQIARQIKIWGRDLGFQQVAVADVDLSVAEPRFLAWLARNFHGEMHYMAAYGKARSRPAQLVPGTLRAICVRMDYLSTKLDTAWAILGDAEQGYVSRYALGRDYHRLIRRRLQQLATRITADYGEFGYRAFCDSAPVLEKALAVKCGLGWQGKHTNLIHRDHSSWFFLGELYTDLPLPLDPPIAEHCGSCTACIDICPTAAIVAPYQLDARKCIAYLTIELKGAIPEPYRAAIGNRIYGCDDCQLVCPWNKYARVAAEPAFFVRHRESSLITLFNWDEATFLTRTEGSAIRRIGYHRWLRNIAVALGNAARELADQPAHAVIITALQARQHHPAPLVREHVQWALAQAALKSGTAAKTKNDDNTDNDNNNITASPRTITAPLKSPTLSPQLDSTALGRAGFSSTQQVAPPRAPPRRKSARPRR